MQIAFVNAPDSSSSLKKNILASVKQLHCALCKLFQLLLHLVLSQDNKLCVVYTNHSKTGKFKNAVKQQDLGHETCCLKE